MVVPGRGGGDDGPDAPAAGADDALPAGASGGGGGDDGDAGFDYDDRYGGYGDYADGGDDDGGDDADDDGYGDGSDDDDGYGDGSDDDDSDDTDDDDRAPWYSWERWKYIGGGLFLVLSVSGVGYVIWDIVDLLPKPVTIELIRAALRESPGRITDVLALAGMISFGPPAGVDLMFGATKAANRWVRQQTKKDVAKGRKEGLEIGVEKGRKEGRAEGIEIGRAEGRDEGIGIGRRQAIDEMRAQANGNPEARRLLEEMDADGDGV